MPASIPWFYLYLPLAFSNIAITYLHLKDGTSELVFCLWTLETDIMFILYLLAAVSAFVIRGYDCSSLAGWI